MAVRRIVILAGPNGAGKTTASRYLLRDALGVGEFVNADAIGYKGSELQDAINGDAKALAKFETIRAYGAVRMGLIKHIDEAAKRQHTPKVAFVAPLIGLRLFRHW